MTRTMWSASEPSAGAIATRYRVPSQPAAAVDQQLHDPPGAQHAPLVERIAAAVHHDRLQDARQLDAEALPVDLGRGLERALDLPDGHAPDRAGQQERADALVALRAEDRRQELLDRLGLRRRREPDLRDVELPVQVLQRQSAVEGLEVHLQEVLVDEEVRVRDLDRDPFPNRLAARDQGRHEVRHDLGDRRVVRVVQVGGRARRRRGP